MVDVVVPVVLDGFIFAAATAVIALSGREFGFLNLAAGAWIVVGGWLSSWLIGAEYVQLEPAWFLAIGAIAVVQISSPLWLRERLRTNPLAYLFVSLGAAIAVGNIGGNYLLANPGVALQPENSASEIGILVLGAIGIASVAVSTTRSNWWSHLALRFRVAKENHGGVWRRATYLLALEILLLLILGSIGDQVHKGVFGAAEYRALVPVLALLACGRRAVPAMFVAFLVVASTHTATSLAPHLSGINADGYAKAVVLLVLLVPVVKAAWPHNVLSGARTTEVVPGMPLYKEGRRGVWSTIKALARSEYQRKIVFAAVLVTAGVASGLLLAMTPTFEFVPQQLHQMLRVLVYTLVVWLVVRHTGVITIALPAAAALPVYITIVLNLTIAGLLVACFGVVLLFALYLVVLRAVRSDVAIVIDVSAVVVIYHLIESTPAISGIHGLVLFPSVLGEEAVWMAVLQGVLAVGLVSVAIVVSRSTKLRGWTIALANMAVGRAHGVGTVMLSIAATVAVALPAFAASAIFHNVNEAVTASQAGLEFGLAVGLFGYLMAGASAWLAIAVILGLYGVLGSTLLGAGAVFDVAVGVTLIAAAWLIGSRRKVLL